MGRNEATRKIGWVKVCLAGAIVFYGGVNLFEAFILHYYYTNNGFDDKKWRKVAGKAIIPADYISISIGLVTASTYLLVNMHKHF